MLIERRRQQREPRIDLAVIRQQVRLGHIELEAALRMLGDVVVDHRQRFAPLLLLQQDRLPRACAPRPRATN